MWDIQFAQKYTHSPHSSHLGQFIWLEKGVQACLLIKAQRLNKNEAVLKYYSISVQQPGKLSTGFFFFFFLRQFACTLQNSRGGQAEILEKYCQLLSTSPLEYFFQE